jgi:phosphatidylserine/phosphatidylglycerophosphate/cardiolipin synthase-like enzyme
MAAIEERTLLDGGQTAEDVAAGLIAWLGEARRSLDIALYDVRLPGAVGDAVADAVRALAARGVGVRIAYNVDGDRSVKALPAPPRTEPSLLEALGVPLRAIPGDPDLMHHKNVVRDGAAVWTGSTNWTLDSWTREENVLLTVASEGIARAYARDFEDLWRWARRGQCGRATRSWSSTNT